MSSNSNVTNPKSLEVNIIITVTVIVEESLIKIIVYSINYYRDYVQKGN